MGLQDACAVVSTWMSFPPIVGTATLGSNQLKAEYFFDGLKINLSRNECAVVSTWMSFLPIVGTATLGSDQLKTE